MFCLRCLFMHPYLSDEEWVVQLVERVFCACKGLQDAMQRQQVPIAEALPPTITHMKSGAQVQYLCLPDSGHEPCSTS